MSVPFRTGLTTIRALLNKICKLSLIYRDVILAVLPVEQHPYFFALETACRDFLDNTTNPRP